MKNIKLTMAVVLCCVSVSAWATPSTQIWIPSTDIQKAGTYHLNFDNYISSGKETNGAWKAPLSMIGPTLGVYGGDKVQAEAGFDLMRNGSAADSSPLYLNAKVASPEGTAFKDAPAFAFGGYNFGTDPHVTAQNVVYALAARTLPKIGRLSAGYYVGNSSVLIDENGKSANNGLLLSWDRTITEVSDKLWAAVDYQGGESSLGALNLGVSWAFAANTSVLFGYDIYNNAKVAGKNTYTVQLDINF
jgi:hypothetical protein